MTLTPELLAAEFVAAGCERLIVHAESVTHLHRSLDIVRSVGATAGVALAPATPAIAVRHVLDLVDLVLVMTVNPGFGGQDYLRHDGAEGRARSGPWWRRRGWPIDVEVDGGISAETVAGAAAAGANVLVAGSALFHHPDGLKAAVAELRALAEAAFPSAGPDPHRDRRQAVGAGAGVARPRAGSIRDIFRGRHGWAREAG